MNSVERSALVAYGAERMYELVADVEAYPQFLPWCKSAESRTEFNGDVIASLGINFSGVRQRFTTRNRHDPNHSIDISLVSGPFKSLHGQWRFTPLSPQACKVELVLSYEFANALLQRLVGSVFHRIAATLMESFIKRAEQLDTIRGGDAAG